MNKPGVVLISTLLIVMVMSIISIQISKNFFLSIQRDLYIDFKNHSLQLLLSSEKQAIKSIQKEMISSNEKLINKDPVLNQSYFFSNELATIQVDVSDASNCFNLNSIFIKTGDGIQIKKDNREWLERLLRLKGLDAPEIESFIDQLIDWVDPDNQPLNFGAENYFYIGPLSPINQYTPKRLLSNLSEIKNFPVLDQISFKKISNNLCVLPGLSNQLINVNILNDSHINLIASLFDEENLEFIESQILDTPENGYDSANEFANKISQSVSWPSQVLSINSKTFLISTKIYNQTFSNQLDSLVILDTSNSAKVLNRDFIF
ncbi:type II secretion system minor pseudopilin GspK [Gammaproteobacteria bacterium]|nr:type II secretion system minor pseudopilin GspK [Gammaproteobacteria bacterium]